ncbi:alpha-2-macroglobulin [Alishewanella sp. SMS8]|uniref:alpha-2-macroglobulin n=1 Tax=Alishewanella sp. SMS8 TaxID=2994676 RepID=UPI002742927A|nr:alpha-2-macroglobulin [Alishewanella sp. SMS8]MDP5460175.1 alpha-2-macroglobulin [Alishewanella sp. SMS8]
MSGSSSLFTRLFGQLSWAAPAWLAKLQQQAKAQPKRFGSALLIVLLALMSLALFTRYYWQLPKAPQVLAQVIAPGQGEIVQQEEQPTPLLLRFYQEDPASDNAQLADVNPARISLPITTVNLSAAKLALIGESLAVGDTITPAIQGQWQWLDDNQLQFLPEQAWPAGQRYQITLPKTWFADKLALATREWSFDSPALNVAIEQLQFYQDPEQVSVRRILATLAFTHAVEQQSLQKALSLNLPQSAEKLGSKAQSVAYTLQSAEQGRVWYLQSEPISLPKQAQFLTFELAAGVKAQYGQGRTQEAQQQQVLIPDHATVLQISDAQLQLVRNAQAEPEQVLQLSLTDRVRFTDLTAHLQLYLLPLHPAKRTWTAAELTPAILAQARLLHYQLEPGAFAHQQDFAIKLDLPAQRQLAVIVKAGLPGLDNYQLSQTYQRVMTLPDYPKEARITGEGAVLMLSGEQKLQLVSRGLPQLKVRLAKVLPQHLNHLISQSGGDISNPFFYNRSFGAENLAVITEQIFEINNQTPQKNQFLSLDLKPHLQREGMGVYFVELYQHDPKYPDWLGEVLDKRLVLVTDLGLMVKHQQDSSQKIFVMSLASGKPVNGAKVQLLGRNGLAVYSGITDKQGHVELGVTNGLKEAEQATVYLVQHTDNGRTDSTFIPFNRYSRQLDYSRFAIDGEYQSGNAAQLKAFMFSDRGIYRPGETVQLASIIRRSDLAPVTAKNLSLQLQVNGPRGNTLHQQKFTLSARGLQSFQLDTAKFSDTGEYDALIMLVDSQGRHQQTLGDVSFQLEEFLPDSLKITSKFNQQATGWLLPEQLSLALQLDNLFGSAAQQRRVAARYVLMPSAFQFDAYPDYQFGIPNEQSLVAQRENLTEQQTDSAGQVTFSLPLQRFQQGHWQLQVYVEGFDSAGGRAVQHSNGALIATSPVLIGMKADGALNFLKQQQARQLHFLAINQQLAPLAQDNLTLKLVQKTPLSSLVKQPDGTLQYQTVLQQKVIAEQNFSIAEQGQTYQLNTDQPGDYQLQLFNKAGEVVSQTDYTVVGNANLTAQLEQNAELQLKLSKSDYQPGEWLEFSVTAPYTGSGLITIETNKVVAFRWFQADSSHSMQRIQIPADLQGNAYLNVSFVRAAGAPELLLSPLSYAVQPFNIARAARTLQLNLTAPALIQPGREFSFSLSSDQPADVLLYGVDAGILQVAAYDLPDPLAFFLQKRALQVRSMQMLDLILPEFSALQRLTAGPGGDTERIMVSGARLKSDTNPFARRVEQPGVFWLGVVKTDANGSVHQARLPDTFNGTVQLMAVGVSEQALGATRQDVLVRGPFVLQPDVFTAVAPADEFEISLSISNMLEGSGKALPLELKTTVSQGLTLLSEPMQSITVDEGAAQVLRLKLKANEQPGEASIRFSVATIDGLQSSQRELSLSIRPAQPYLRQLQFGYSKSGQQQLNATALLPVLAERQLTAGSSPLLLVDRLSHYLDTYPHGCTEQMVSQVFPWIPLVKQAHFQAQWPQLNEKFAKLLQALAERQQADGGFAFWPGHTQSADFPSLYVIQFLLEAEQQGFAVPHYMLERALNYLRSVSQAAGANLYQARLRAQAIYLLSVKGEQVSNALTYLHERLTLQHEQRWQSDILAVYMAASYQILQQPSLAQSLLKPYQAGKTSLLERDYKPVNRIAQPFANAEFQSQFNLDSQYLLLLARHFPEQAAQLSSEQLLTQLEPLFAGDYHTQAAAYSILALAAYADIKPNTLTVLPTLSADGEKLALMDNWPYAHATTGQAVQQFSLNAGYPLFYALSEQGYAAQLPSKARADGVELVRDYLNSEGEKITSASQGQLLTVRLRLRSLTGATISNMVITDLLPAGFEVVRSSVPRQSGLWQADYMDIREDRVLWYGAIAPQMTELTYQVRVSTAGRFTVPVASAEAMYDNRVRAYTPAGQLEVSAYQAQPTRP